MTRLHVGSTRNAPAYDLADQTQGSRHGKRRRWDVRNSRIRPVLVIGRCCAESRVTTPVILFAPCFVLADGGYFGQWNLGNASRASPVCQPGLPAVRLRRLDHLWGVEPMVLYGRIDGCAMSLATSGGMSRPPARCRRRGIFRGFAGATGLEQMFPIEAHAVVARNAVAAAGPC